MSTYVYIRSTEVQPRFDGLHVVQSLVVCVVGCCPLFVFSQVTMVLSVRPRFYGVWLSLWYHQKFLLSTLFLWEYCIF